MRLDTLPLVRVWLLAALAVFSLALPARAGQSVEAKGFSFYEPGREPLAREKAMEEAKRAAVEKAVGVAVQSASEVRDFVLVRDQILSRSSGYLTDIQVIDEKKTDLGTIEVTIRAMVETTDMAADMDRFSRMLSAMKNPSVAVVVDEKLPPDTRAAAVKTANLLIARLKQSGFKVVDPAASSAPPGLIMDVNLQSSSKDVRFQDMNLTVNEVDLSVAIKRPGDGEILATASQVAAVPGESPLKALDRGADSCVSRIWEELRKKLAQAWEKETFGPRELAVTVEGLPDMAAAERLRQALNADVPKVAGAELVKYKKRKGWYKVLYKGRPEFLADELTMSYFGKKHLPLEVEGAEGNSLSLRTK